MNYFTIRDIENICGIKAHTLRIWEQRYNLFVPKRKESNHRIYSNDDLKALLRISFLYHHGIKISKIAQLSAADIDREMHAITTPENNHEMDVHELIGATIDLDKESFEKKVNCILLRIGLEKTIKNVFYPFLHRIGLLWLTNNVIPAQEHFSIHIIRKKIICGIDGLEPNYTRPSHVVVFTPTNEYHELPLLIANYYLKKNNTRTAYFGTNVSPKSLVYYSEHHPVTVLYTHVVTNMCNDGINQYINELCDLFPTQKIIVSGPAAVLIKKKSANLRLLHSFDEMIAWTAEIQ